MAEKKSPKPPKPKGYLDRWYLAGLVQVLVDIEVHGPRGLAREFGLVPGESIQLSQPEHQRLLERIEQEGIRCSYAAGGTVANTLNNYTFLSGEPAVLLGAIDDAIRPGHPAFHYLAQTPKSVDLSSLVPVAGNISTAITFISPEGERSFAVAPGVSNDYPSSAIPGAILEGAAVAVTSLYCLRDPDWPIAEATLRFMRLAARASVPVAFALGTAGLVRELRTNVIELLRETVNLAAMNAQEAQALTGESDALLACQKILEWVDMVIITEGPRGLTMGGYVDERYKRETDQQFRSKAIAEYNRYEYSRLMRKADCRDPVRVYTHIHPYRGGPKRMTNTSGAGDAALAAVLHDVAANQYHRATVPQSEKHASGVPFLTYSSLSRCAQYGNRVAYEVLRGQSPRLDGPVGPDEAEQVNENETS